MPKKEKRFTVSISFPEEKMEALELYLKEKDSDLELELEDFVEKLYTRTVPASIRSFLSAKEKSSAKKSADAPEPEPSPAAYEDADETAQRSC